MEGRATLILATGEERELGSGLSIGRADENDLVLDDTTVSRQHALVLESGERWFLEDRGSFNGTFLNGVRVQPGVRLPLRHGDRISFGSHAVVFSWPAGIDDIDRTRPLAQVAPPRVPLVGRLAV